MQPEDINRTIADQIGWTSIEENPGSMLGVKEYVGYQPKTPVIGRKIPIPDFMRDLNACEEMQNNLQGGSYDKEWVAYCTYLVGPELANDRMMFGKDLCSAPAWRRCHAFMYAKQIFWAL